MDKIKKYIIIVLCSILIIVIALLFFNSDFEKSKQIKSSGDVGENELNNNTKIEKVSELNEFYTVKVIADAYVEAFLEENNEELYNVLDPEYISSFNVTQENVCSKLNLISNYNVEEQNYYKYHIDKMYVSKHKNISTYFINGTIINTSSEYKSNFMFMIELDTNSYYYILPQEYMESQQYNFLKEDEQYNTHLTKIQNTEYNQYEFQENNDEYTVILDHMSKLTDYLVYNLDNSYNLFDNNYKNKRFNTLNDYKMYIQNNIKYILSSTIKKYKIIEDRDYTEYICIDQYGNYYIFKDKGVMDYTVMLDTYTVDSEEFNNKYNNGSEQLKVGMNLEKVFQALNRKDYKYIYEKLDNNFKQNNFSTLTDFEIYAKNTFYDMNKIEYGEFEEKSGVYVYKITLSDATQSREDENTNEDNKIAKNFIVKLEDNNNFKMAFNVD